MIIILITFLNNVKYISCNLHKPIFIDEISTSFMFWHINSKTITTTTTRKRFLGYKWVYLRCDLSQGKKTFYITTHLHKITSLFFKKKIPFHHDDHHHLHTPGSVVLLRARISSYFEPYTNPHNCKQISMNGCVFLIVCLQWNKRRERERELKLHYLHFLNIKVLRGCKTSVPVCLRVSTWST